MSKSSEWARAEKEREEELFLEREETKEAISEASKIVVDNVAKGLTAVKLIDALKDSKVIKKFNEDYLKKFGKPSIFDDRNKK
jgi:hypothetical protein